MPTPKPNATLVAGLHVMQLRLALDGNRAVVGALACHTHPAVAQAAAEAAAEATARLFEARESLAVLFETLVEVAG